MTTTSRHTIHVEALQRYLSTAPRRFPGGPVPAIHCRDGFHMSVQASSGTYCTPRNDSGPWSQVEIGYPNRIEPLLFEYAETKGDWTQTVYGWVPIELVAAVIELHGGMATDET